MYYVGVDLHKETSWFYVVDQQGNKIDSRNVSNKVPALKHYFASLPRPFTVAVEATYNWYFMVDLAEQYADKVYLANSYELKAFAKRHKKTDKIDACLIATLLQKGFLPVVSIADKATRILRELLRYRIALVTDRSRTIFRLKMLLDKLALDSTGNFTTHKRLSCLAQDTSSLPPTYQQITEQYRERIVFLTKKIGAVHKDIVTGVAEDVDIKNMMSIRGLNYFSAGLVKSEIITVKRFASFNRLCAYAGLSPRVAQSATKTVHGPLNRNRRKHLQWILMETVFHFIQGYPSKKEKFLRIQRRKGYHTAKVALARDMLQAIYVVLKQKRPFYDSKEDYKNQIQPVAADALCGV